MAPRSLRSPKARPIPRRRRASRVISVDAAGRVKSVELEDTRKRLESLAWLLDHSIQIPGTRFRIGLDPLIGLFPFVGDLIGVALSSYILSEAARLGAPKSLLVRMAFNVALEGLVGIVPIAGDVFDAAWKANRRNVGLLNAWLEEPRRTTRSSRLFTAGLIAAMAGFVALVGLLGFLLIRALVQAL